MNRRIARKPEITRNTDVPFDCGRSPGDAYFPFRASFHCRETRGNCMVIICVFAAAYLIYLVYALLNSEKF
ncbi:potassium-transporting ATPase subunit F [Paenibacillus sp. T1]|uniref:Potassium-transporting ATPase subunit F n=1 Tax=Paenibacillus glycinis TaxID=2697035 RepID=A0ABW9XRN8_9BACL|nr:potassium-transporting ATPase subunit F [Paenibacillus glycinis]